MFGGRTEHSPLVYLSLFLLWSDLRSYGSLLPLRMGGRANHRNKSQLPPQLQSEGVQLSPADDHPGLLDVIKKLGALTTALATTNVKVDSLPEHVAPEMANPAKQPSHR